MLWQQVAKKREEEIGAMVGVYLHVEGVLQNLPPFFTFKTRRRVTSP